MRNRIYYPSLLIFAAVFISSCVSTNATRLTNKTFPKVPSSSVRVFLGEEDIENEYVEVAIIYSKGSTTWTDKSDLIQKSKEVAAGLGANAIILYGIDEPSTGAKVAGAVFGVGTNRQGQVVAIRVLNSKEDLGSKEQ